MDKKFNDKQLPNFHTDKDLFLAALQFTSRQTGFLSTLIEKDYFGSLLLSFLYQQPIPLIFRGGTCLNKVHMGFCRLSEDLDFMIPISSKAKREERSATIKPVKSILEKLSKTTPILSIAQVLQGQNESRQYNGIIQYISLVTGEPSQIKIEIGLREELAQKPIAAKAKTLLQDPFKIQPAISEIGLLCLGLKEALAEKARAALTRKDPAIRDYFDLYFANQKASVSFNDKSFVELVCTKLKIPGTGPVCLPDDLDHILLVQLEAQLKPVLREKDFEQFQLMKAIKLVRELAQKVLA